MGHLLSAESPHIVPQSRPGAVIPVAGMASDISPFPGRGFDVYPRSLSFQPQTGVAHSRGRLYVRRVLCNSYLSHHSHQCSCLASTDYPLLPPCLKAEECSMGASSRDILWSCHACGLCQFHSSYLLRSVILS